MWKQLMSACWRLRSGDRWRRSPRISRSSKFGVVAGCLVTEGAVKRNNPIRVLRDNVVIFEGALESLRRFKDDVAEVRAGTECGIGVKNYQDVRANDQIECYSRTEIIRTIQ
jgi:translation initiation factor IF-2